MKTTLRIEDSLLRELKERATREEKSFTELVNQVLRRGLAADASKAESPKQKFRRKTYDMGQPKFDLNKALALAGELEDEEVIAKMKNATSRSSYSKTHDKN